ncbi:hypothetical protein [Enhydrobacter sp.]|jgi:hypothetical protein|uniref:hypothetical protein n=1 Tax=Enhydrobacter sp. TaxID=1894999 RepID=UPI002606F979|nr:hypothetical protein [Enhydrobacter sp.]WIM12548.1 MAG: hypothetical protein OJF58_003510 [Enhydrobacter sp.]
MKARFWRDEAKAAYKFARTILAAFIDNKRPQDIKAPDGSSFLWPTEEQIKGQQKSSIRRCYSLSVRIQRGDAILKSEASAELSWLAWVGPAAWQKVDNDHFRFVKKVLEAVRDGQQPSDIRKPDGDYFVWPTTEVGVDAGGGDVDPPVEFGVLRARGYRVGKSAKPTSERWVTLRRVYEEPLDDLARSVINLDEWGYPRSSRRLCKLANAIASFTRNMKRRSDGSDLAVRHWTTDLSYLKRTYYDGKHEPYFLWPQAPAQD